MWSKWWPWIAVGVGTLLLIGVAVASDEEKGETGAETSAVPLSPAKATAVPELATPVPKQATPAPAKVTAVPEQATPAPEPATPVVEEMTEDERKGFHCLSPWDGNHSGMEALIREKMNDPDSMKTRTTSIAPVQGGIHAIKVDFTGKNALGGTVRHTANGFIDHDTCEATLWSIE